MEFARINKDKIIKLYVDEGKSSYEVAEALNTYSTKVLRALDFLGIEKRSYSQAQANSLKSGRTAHPTKGKKLKEEHKKKIGESRSRTWSNLSAEEKERLSTVGKELWNKKSESEKEEMNPTPAPLSLTNFTNSSPLPSLINPHKFEIFWPASPESCRCDFIRVTTCPVSWLSEFDSSPTWLKSLNEERSS